MSQGNQIEAEPEHDAAYLEHTNREHDDLMLTDPRYRATQIEADVEIARHTFATPLAGIYQTSVVYESESGVYAVVSLHAKNEAAPAGAVVTITEPSEVRRLADEILGAKRAELPPRPQGSEMLRRSYEMPSTTAGG